MVIKETNHTLKPLFYFGSLFRIFYLK